MIRFVDADAPPQSRNPIEPTPVDTIVTAHEAASEPAVVPRKAKARKRGAVA